MTAALELHSNGVFGHFLSSPWRMSDHLVPFLDFLGGQSSHLELPILVCILYPMSRCSQPVHVLSPLRGLLDIRMSLASEQLRQTAYSRALFPLSFIPNRKRAAKTLSVDLRIITSTYTRSTYLLTSPSQLSSSPDLGRRPCSTTITQHTQNALHQPLHALRHLRLASVHPPILLLLLASMSVHCTNTHVTSILCRPGHLRGACTIVGLYEDL